MMNPAKSLVFVLSVLLSGSVCAAGDMAQIAGGSYRPLYLKKDRPMIAVKPFLLDKKPVTNAQFAAFVRSNPKWQRDAVSARLAESAYLNHWVKNGEGYAPKSADLHKPVTNVSWFAAHAYCAAQGKRLPTIDEWEYAGQASETKQNGTGEAGYNRVILDWYADGGSRGLSAVGKSKPNYWGVYDMHGMIWEWTEDFTASLISAGKIDQSQLCGSGSANSTDPGNYAAFMRFGIRTSLKAPYVLNNLGFRCAR